jgi:hypothetical protein
MSEHDASYYDRQFADRQAPSSRPEGFPCRDPFHADTCFGAPHRLRQPDEVWCAQCDQPSVFAVRMPYGIEALCALHGLELAKDTVVYAVAQRLSGIEQYQAEGR